MRTEPLFISAIIACPERAESGNTDVRGERHSYFLSAAESTETIPTATAPRITDAQLSSRKELLESIRNGKYKPSSVRRAEIPKDNGDVRMLQYSDKSSNRAFSFFPTEKLSISVVGINEIEVFPELFRLALHCFISSENRHFGCGDG